MNFKCLLALDLSDSGIEKVSDSISKLKRLRYLDLSDNWFNQLPKSIVKLQNLQVLNLSGCYPLEELPKDITKLVNLRHLNCEDCNCLTHMPRGIGQLTSLMTLGWFVVSENRVSKQMGRLNELNLLNNLRGYLFIKNLEYAISEFEAANLKEKQHLQSLDLFWGFNCEQNDYDDKVLQSLQPHPNLKKLEVWNYRGLRFPSWLSSLINLVDISLINCKRCKHLPPLDCLPSLQSLYISGFDDLESIEIDEGDNYLNKGGGGTFFPSLKSIDLSFCPNLKEWGKKGDCKHAEPLQFPCLSSLRIRICPKLTQMPLFPTLDEELELSNVNGAPLLLTMTMTISASPPNGASSSSSLMLPLSKLKKLSMWYMIDLESLPPEGLQNLTSLQKLLIEDCSSLKYLPKEMQLLTNLRELEVTRCPQLKERCENNKSVDWPHIVHIPNIKIGALTIQRDGKYMLDD